MSTPTRCQAASGIAVLTLGSLATAIGLTQTTLSPDPSGSGQVLAQPRDTVYDTEVALKEATLRETDGVRGPGKRPVMDRPVIKLPPRPIGEVPPIKVPPVKERISANEGVGNGVDGNTPGHDNNGGNDDPQFSPGNPGAKN